MVTTIEKLRKIGGAYKISGGINSLADYAFNFDEFMRVEQFPRLNNVGTVDKCKAVKHILSTAEYSADGLATALNDSKIGYTNWIGKPIFNARRVGFVLVSEDQFGNKFLIFIITNS